MKVDELLALWPSSATVFIAHRMACIGCLFAAFHTTRQACEVYDLDPNQFTADVIAGASLTVPPVNESEDL